MKRIFVSSVQREFAQVRKQLKTHLSRNPAYRRLFESFVFEEDVIATDRRTMRFILMNSPNVICILELSATNTDLKIRMAFRRPNVSMMRRQGSGCHA